MAQQTWYTGARQEITFNSADFLEEAINDFLESGAKTSRFASAIIKVATGVELLLKDALERICPALILDKLDEGGLQIAKLYGLGNRMRSPKELESVELRTAAFPTLLVRAAKFFDIAAAAPHLHRLHKIRNSLIHHKGKVDVLETNLLLVQQVFPFVEKMSKVEKVSGLRISDDTWKKIRELETLSVDVLSSQLAKKIAHHFGVASRLSKGRVSLLTQSKPETTASGEDIIEDGLVCPACRNEAAAIFQDVDVDYDESGPVAGYFVFNTRCRVCGLDLDESEIRHIIANFKDYIPVDKQHEKRFWEQAIEPEMPNDSY